MKRFITYLYEYRDGKKTKNVGFLRVDIRKDYVNVEVSVRNYMHADGMGKLYGLFEKEELQALEWSDIQLFGGQCNQKFTLEEDMTKDGEFTIEKALGVVLVFEEDGYVASCWNDAYADGIAQREFSIGKDEIIEMAEKTLVKESVKTRFDIGNTMYKKIVPEQIRDLPSANWHLSENSFLKHGAYNYGFLFLKTEWNEKGEYVWLGVPGYYEKQELLMALLFGFSEFEAVPKVAVDAEMNTESVFSNIEKNQEPKTGIFGGWFVLLDK